MLADKAGIQLFVAEGRRIGQCMQEADVGLDAANAILLQRLHHTVDGTFAAVIPYDQFGNHRVVVDADLVTLDHTGIHTHVGIFIRGAQVTQGTGGRQEVVVRIFGINAGFKGMTAQLDLLLLQRQRFAVGNAQLPLHQILTGDHLGDRVLDLQTGVHLHKVEGAIHVIQEFDCTGTHVIDGLSGAYGGLTHCLAGLGAEPWSGCLFQHLLVAALHGAVTLGQVHTLAFTVAEHLNLDMAGLGQIFLDQHVRIAERVFRFALGSSKRIVEFAHRLNHTHALAATTGDRLQ